MACCGGLLLRLLRRWEQAVGSVMKEGVSSILVNRGLLGYVAVAYIIYGPVNF